MHEYSVGQALMERIEAEASARGATAVHRVRLTIGDVAGIEPELLATAFSILQEHTICAHAVLDIERVPATWACSACNRPIEAGGVLCCPDCGAAARLVSGDEIVLAQLEMEVP
jgi:hydrogenase nickel incorporation protein HypA/HybF